MELNAKGFDGMFDNQEEEEDRYDPYFIDSEISAIIREAIDPKLKTRDYAISKNDSIKKFVGQNRIFLKNFEDKTKISAIYIPTLEISVDMLKREIQKDKNAVKSLGLAEAHSILKIGIVAEASNTFCAFQGSASLLELKVQQDDQLFVSFVKL